LQSKISASAGTPSERWIRLRS